jgi:hypothetical protein
MFALNVVGVCKNSIPMCADHSMNCYARRAARVKSYSQLPAGRLATSSPLRYAAKRRIGER